MSIEKLANSSLMSLSTDELLILPKLQRLAQEAVDSARTIQEKIRFRINEGKKVVWSDDNNFEYVTPQGFWQARYLHQTYDVSCDSESIYKLYRDEHLFWIAQNEGEETKNEALTYASLVAPYFRSFIRRLKEGA